MATTQAMPVGERKHVTAVFLDIVSFSEVASSVDPEDLQAWLEVYYRQAGQIIETHGGEVTEYLGDGIVAMFGLSRADELSAMKAVRAAQETVDHFAASTGGPIRAIKLRAGIATGEVVVREDTSKNWPRITGTVTTLAQRVQEQAEPNTVLISQSTERLLRGKVPVTSLEDRALKGFAEAQTLFVVGGELAPATPAPRKGIIGREAELQRLAQSTKPVLMLGQAGHGKSALAAEVASRAAARDFFLADGVNSGSSYHPFREWLIYRLGKSEPGFGDLTARFDHLSERHCRCLALILGMAEGQALLTETSNTGLNAQIQAALWEAVGTGPVGSVLVFEDLHWFDQASLDVIGHILDVHDGAKVRVLMTSRPTDTLARLADRPEVDKLELAPLPPDDAMGLLDTLGGADMSAEARAMLLERAAGIPLFIEQLFLRGAASTQDQVPATLADLLAERVDEAGPLKPLLQKMSALGRVFSLDLVQAIAPDFAEPQPHLQALEEAGVLRQRSDTEWAFSHALLRDAAYQSILRRTRRDLHSDIATILQRDFPHLVARDPATLAEHQRLAGQIVDATSSFLAASKWALLQGAFADAEAHAGRALKLSQSKDLEAPRPDLEIECYTAIGSVVMQYAGFTAPPVRDAFDQVHRIARNRALPGLENSAALFGSFSFAIVAADQRKSDEFQDLLIDLSKRAPQDATGDEIRLAALAVENCSSFYKGAFDRQFEKIAQIRDLYRAEDHAMMIARYGMDIFAAAQMFETPARAITAQMDVVPDLVAETDAHQALLNIPVMQPYALIWGAVPLHYAGHQTEARARLARGMAAAEEQQAGFWQMTGAGWYHILNAPEGVPDQTYLDGFALAVATHEAVGASIGLPYFRAHYASQLAAAGHLDDAYAASTMAVTETRAHRLHTWYSEILRLHARTCAAMGQRDEAEMSLRLAWETAERQGAHLWKLKVLLETFYTLGTLDAEAMTDVLSAFPDVTDHPDARRARDLLGTG